MALREAVGNRAEGEVLLWRERYFPGRRGCEIRRDGQGSAGHDRRDAGVILTGNPRRHKNKGGHGSCEPCLPYLVEKKISLVNLPS